MIILFRVVLMPFLMFYRYKYTSETHLDVVTDIYFLINLKMVFITVSTASWEWVWGKAEY